MDQIAEENKWTCEEELIEDLKELRLISLQNAFFWNVAIYWHRLRWKGNNTC